MVGKGPLTLPRALRAGPNPLPAGAGRGNMKLSLAPFLRGEGWGPLRQQWEGEGHFARHMQKPCHKGRQCVVSFRNWYKVNLEP
jgi:hypothetical protein